MNKQHILLFHWSIVSVWSLKFIEQFRIEVDSPVLVTEVQDWSRQPCAVMEIPIFRAAQKMYLLNAWRESESRSVMSDSLLPHGLYSPWNSPGQNTGVGSLSLQRTSQPRDRSQVSRIAGRFFTSWATKEILYQILVSWCFFLTISVSDVSFR